MAIQIRVNQAHLQERLPPIVLSEEGQPDRFASHVRIEGECELIWELHEEMVDGCCKVTNASVYMEVPSWEQIKVSDRRPRRTRR